MSANAGNGSRSSAERADLPVPANRAIQPVRGGGALDIDLFGTPSSAGPAAPVRRVTLDGLWRHKWLAVAVFVCFSIPAGAAAWYLHVPMYRVQAAVKVEPQVPQIAFRTEDHGYASYQQRRNDQATTLQSADVLNRVLADADVQKTQWYAYVPAFTLFGSPSRLERLKEDLDLSMPRDSSFIYVTMEWRDPAEAMRIVNAVIREYLWYVEHAYSKDEDLVLTVLEDKLAKIKSEIVVLNGDIAQLLEGSGLYTVEPDALVQQQALSLATKQEELDELQRGIDIAQRRIERMGANEPLSSQPTDVPADGQSAPRTVYAADPEWRRLNEALKDAELAVMLAEDRLGDSHPEKIRLRAVKEVTQEKLASRERQLDDLQPAQLSGSATQGPETVRPVASARELESHIQDLQDQSALVRAEIETTKKELAEKTRKVRELKEQRARLKELENLRELYWSKELARKTEREAPPSIKPYPALAPPSQPVNGKRRFMLFGMALFGGMALGLGAAYLRASTNPAVQEVADVLGPVETPFLGYLPEMRESNAISSAEEAVQAEHIRMVRTALLERIELEGASAVLITSAGSRAGKTTVAVLLAKSLAQCGKRVLLVDADLRNPSVSARCNLSDGPGLIGVLTRTASDADAITGNGIGRLDILPAGRLDASPDPELLANGVFSASLERWRRQYDMVVLDTPPVIPVADARILARQVDGAVLVAREDHCRRDEVIEALAAISASGGRLFGTVFVGSPRRRRGYTPYYSHYYARTPASQTSEAAGTQET